MVMPGRYETGSDSYRYSFQGQEHDDEIKGNNNSLNYKYRMHDPRVGRFFAIDPLAAKYPFNSTYAFSENKVIAWIELEGQESSPTSSTVGSDIPSYVPSEYNNTPHETQGFNDSYWGVVHIRTYNLKIKGSKMTALEIMKDLNENFDDYTAGQSYFEKIKGKVDGMEVGDEFFISGGPSPDEYDLDDYADNEFVSIATPGWWKKNRPELVDDENVLHLNVVETGVTVVAVNMDGENGEYYFTFKTWEGHAEAGYITFKASQGENGDINFKISSVAGSGGPIDNLVYLVFGGMEMQTDHWMNFFDNLVKKSEGTETSRDNSIVTTTVDEVNKTLEKKQAAKAAKK